MDPTWRASLVEHGYAHLPRLVPAPLVAAARAAIDEELRLRYDAAREREYAARTYCPKLLGTRPNVTHRWAGIWGTTPDLVPLVGRVPGRENVWVAGGYSGHGNALGLACGDLVARAILGEASPLLEIFDPARFAA